jgi:hypothetical protein
MLRALLVVSFFVMLCAFTESDPWKCKVPTDHLFSLVQLRSRLIGGEWQYQYSFFEDTCFTIERPIMVPKLMRFRIDADSVEHRKTRHEQNLPNIICTHRDNFSGAMIETFPGWGGYFDADTLREYFPVSQVPAGSTKGMKDKVCYNVTSIYADTMVVTTGYCYDVNGRSHCDVQHVFYRFPVK